jgi:CBS domain containing-hemolysin-like protein
MITLLLFFFLALVVSFLCSLLEAVILSVSHSFVALYSREHPVSGRILKRLKDNINRPLAAILTLNTIANTVGAAGVGAVAFDLFGSRWVAIISGLLTLSILVFSEIIPKTIGALHWKRLAGVSAYLIRGLVFILYPFVLFLEAASGWLSKGKKTGTVTREEMIVLAEMGEDEGTIEEKESTIIENLMKLKDITVEEVLTPRSVIFALQKDETVRDVLERHEHISFSRIPVYNQDIDDIVGLVSRYNLMKSKAEDRFDVRMEELMDPIHAVSEKESVAKILDEFVKRRKHLFIVKDEFGQTLGLITLEDAIETLLGIEIVDESDTVVDMRKLAMEKWKERRRGR